MSAPPKFELRFKVVMMGDSGVGKTAIITRVADGTFLTDHVATVGSQFVTLNLVVEGRRVLLELWDTAGQEVYRSLVGFYSRDAQAALLVVDTTVMASFDALPDWVKFIHGESPNAKLLLFGNKVDLPGRTVSTEALKAFANEHGIDFLEGSAKTGQRVHEAFERISEMLIQNCADLPNAQAETQVISVPEKEKPCC